MTEFVTPQLRTVLKTYQDTAIKSLHGPAGLTLVHGPGLHYHHPLLPGDVKDERRSSDDDDGMEEHHRRSRDSAMDEDLVVVPVAAPELPQPILTEPDTNGCGTLYETILEGRRIGCFMLGGEMRLCLPQVLNNVLMDFTLDQINCTCERLQIFCSQCTLEQLNEFKAAKILPEDVKTSGLITRTNAERLCAALLNSRSGEKQPAGAKGAVTSFRVSHKCFGQADGLCVPELFSIKEPVCIECAECGGWFSPQKFVFHGHGPQEEQTCHWGFDSGNWRAYIHVADVEEEACRDKFAALLDEMKEREYRETIKWLQEQRDNAVKRKTVFPENGIPVVDSCKAAELLDILPQARNGLAERGDALMPPHKKSKLALDESRMEWQQQLQSHHQLLLAHMHQQHPQLQHHYQSLSFGPPPHWAALNPKFLPPYVNGLNYLANQQEPPLLQNPERVIRVNECERFERSFQPNVALAPRQRMKETNGNSGAGGVSLKVKQEPIELSSTSSVTITKSVTKSPEQFSTEITSSTSPQPGAPRRQNSGAVQSSTLDEFKENKAITIFPVKTEPLPAVTEAAATPTKAAVKRPPTSEFELSTDTDDESVTGEADSSNLAPSLSGSGVNSGPLAAAHHLLKDPKPENLSKVLDIIKVLLSENWQHRLSCQENLRLQEELRQRDLQIMELQALIRAAGEPQRLLSASSSAARPETIEARSQRPVSPIIMNGGAGRGYSEAVADRPTASPPLPCVKLKRKAIIEMNNCLEAAAAAGPPLSDGGSEQRSLGSDNNDSNVISATNNSNNLNSKNSSANGTTTITAITLPPKKQHDLATAAAATIMKPPKKSLRRSAEEELEAREESGKGTSNDEVQAAAALTPPVDAGTAKPVPLIQSKKHRIFLNKQRQEEEEEKRRSVNKGAAATAAEEKVNVADKMDIDEPRQLHNGESKGPSKKPLANGGGEVGKRNGKIGEEAVNASATVSAATATPMQLQCAG